MSRIFAIFFPERNIRFIFSTETGWKRKRNRTFGRPLIISHYWHSNRSADHWSFTWQFTWLLLISIKQYEEISESPIRYRWKYLSSFLVTLELPRWWWWWWYRTDWTIAVTRSIYVNFGWTAAIPVKERERKKSKIQRCWKFCRNLQILTKCNFFFDKVHRKKYGYLIFNRCNKYIKNKPKILKKKSHYVK